jgi:hypothetical protein
MPEKMKLLLCGIKSPLGAFAEWAVGSASECWCCSYWRGFLWGAAVSGTTTALIYTF